MITEKELEKINLIFNLMNRLSDSSLDEYINSKMKRYEFISKIVKYSIETIRKILARAKTYKYIKIKNYSFKIYYYDVQIYLNYNFLIPNIYLIRLDKSAHFLILKLSTSFFVKW